MAHKRTCCWPRSNGEAATQQCRPFAFIYSLYSVANMTMDIDISNFPLEVVEKILSNLQGEALIAASQVCWLWSCVAHRIMQTSNRDSFSDELLEDLRLDIEDLKGDLLLDLYRETHPNLVLLQETPLVQMHHFAAVLQADGPRLYAGDGVGNVMVYELLESEQSFLSPEPVVSVVIPSGPVSNMSLMKAHDLLFVCSPSQMHVMSTKCTKTGMVCLDPLEPSTPCEHKELTLRVHQDLLGVAEGSSQIKIFRVEGVEENVVIMNQIADFATPFGIFRWKIWNNQVLCVLKTGSVCVWDLEQAGFTHNSEPYSELRYQNPCWLYQRYVLSSSELSRNLLSYWHISCGPAYWLFGRLDGKHEPEPEKYRGIMPSDVTSVCLKRRFLACAKRSPYQIVLYLMPNQLPNDREALTRALQTPLLTFNVPEHINMMELGFQGSRLLLYTYSQPGNIQCYILSR
ncbi:uncharacterized protein LOC132201881 isoform X2 [Neocloeon triangulifer]|uniref:uncharacterized protein LOC132201881 isoform X2 n=1 Tax=Neocloeon triangulifer TaxID=2078957 RepID=UPI00286FA0B9|nr:uncharacterized protein LOC132201881 isoform X2 [Neocloeon triangulifer]